MRTSYIYIICMLSVLLGACSKNWLDAKPDNSLIVPTTISEIQSLLDNDQIFNTQQPALGEMGTDDYILPTSSFSNLQNIERNAYKWQPDIFEGGTASDWDVAYQAVNYANIALEKVNYVQVTEINKSDWNRLYGSALFYRSYAFYTLLDLFAKQYDENTAKSDLGIPLRLSSDINKKTSRSSIEQCYSQLVDDLKIAAKRLPTTSTKSTRPSKLACYAMLARVMLCMKRYSEALLYADSALAVKNSLVDYSAIPSDQFNSFPFPSNDEVIYYTWMLGYSGISFYSYVDSNLYKLYAPNDLRKEIFFRNDGAGFTFKGSYTGFFILFGGLAVDEIYLIKAECHARNGEISEGMAALNKLLEKRWKSNFFIPLTASNPNEAINIIINERRKELVFRGLRWSDLRRFNSEGANITLRRKINNEEFTLLPNDNRYVYPIPQNEIRLSNIEQNPR